MNLIGQNLATSITVSLFVLVNSPTALIASQSTTPADNLAGALRILVRAGESDEGPPVHDQLRSVRQCRAAGRHQTRTNSQVGQPLSEA